MSESVYYAEMGLEIKDAFELKCECGHKLSYHGFVHNVSYLFPHHGYYLLVSQCVMCGIKDNEFVCKEFKLKDRK